MREGSGKLPAGWVATTLGEIAHVEAGQSPPSSSFTDAPEAISFLQGNAEFGEVFPTPRKRTSEPNKFASSNGVLLSVRAPVGATNLAPHRLAIGRGLMAVEPPAGMDRRFLLWLLRYKRQDLEVQATGTTFPAVTGRVVRSLPVLLAPREEQDRIVAIVEAALTHVDAGVRSFTDAHRGLQQYRVACMAAIFDGPTRRLEELALVQSGIAKGRPQGDDLVEMPYIRTANVQALRLELDVIKRLRVTAQQRAKHLLQEDDVLVLEGGDADKVGRGWIWSGEVTDCLHQNHVFAVRPDPKLLLPRFLAYYVNAPQARRYFLSVAKQTTNLASINKTNLKDLPVPLPALEEQRARVATLDEQLSATAEMQAGLQARLEDAQVLRRSLLHAAFEGRLTSQDARDEPVEEMLRRAQEKRTQPLLGSKAMRKKPRPISVRE